MGTLFCPHASRALSLLRRPADIIRTYEQLPKSYRDHEGLAFRRKDLQEWEAKGIFGPDMSADEANRLLRILHGRRVAGTLQDPAFAVHTARYSPQQMGTALAYLRKTVPVDETINAGLRAEDELDLLEQAEKQRKQPAASLATKGAQDAESSQEVYKPDPVYGRSAFDEMRARNVARQKAKAKALKEEAQAAGPAGPVAPVEYKERVPTNATVRNYYEKAQSDLEAPPEMSAWQRILPSAVTVLLALGFMGAVCMVYEEPMPRYRLFKDISASHATVAAIMAVNALVYLGWRIPPLWSLFNRYMIFVVATVKPVSLFTAAFSHMSAGHLLANMIPLWLVGPRLHDELGRARFVTLYVGCGALGFLGSLVVYSLRAGGLVVSSLGASGATLGLVSAYLWEHRLGGFRLFGLPQDGVHGIVFLAMLVASQVGMALTRARFRIDVASHLTGMAAGIAGMELMSRTGGNGRGGSSRVVDGMLAERRRRSDGETRDR
ncbi:hypothetical protein HIM_04015 [Hirsutella minnesotensis 3608]|uniref:Peptidase S54 rhomboid domain-containing protein n=1 Tax=Hirsutella minnesotensis 3608 TaxID=1043627 RepID=A0A0F8A693_9HYPO|nr:hypothetical protein HIM_04015 [Hirsutella minnesotensis 3608]